MHNVINPTSISSYTRFLSLDLKPSNILISRHLNVKIADFVGLRDICL